MFSELYLFESILFHLNSSHQAYFSNYCSALGTYFSSLLIFWISERLTAGPGSFFAPGIGFFSSSEVGGAPSSVSGVHSFLLGGCPAPGRKAPIGIFIFAWMALTLETGCFDIFKQSYPCFLYLFTA